MKPDDSSCQTLLVEPVPAMGAEYRAFLQEFVLAGEEGLLNILPVEIEDESEFILKLKNHAEGYDSPDGSVPCSAYWLLSRDRSLLGEIHIRHRLTPAMENYGGHIGYMVRPSERGKGYGTRMLAFALERAAAMGLERVMITCEPGNVASARVIQRNGGKLIDAPAARGGRVASRYWIDLLPGGVWRG